jgi:glutamine cyclotransferase
MGHRTHAAISSHVRYPGEGWGLTHDRTHLIMSDGSDTLRFLDPTMFQERRRVTVKDGNVAIRDLIMFRHGVVVAPPLIDSWP